MNPNDSNSGVPANVSEKQIVANRKNALMSTGPKTAAGKALVAMNPVAHGVYSVSPVIEQVESKRSWTAYNFAMLDCLAPVGMVEMTLAERIILTAWRQRRVARYETEQIRSEQEGAMEEVGRRLGYKLSRGLTAFEVRNVVDEAKWREERRQRVSALLTASDATPLSEEDAEDLLWFVHEQLGQSDRFEGYWEQLPAAEAWTIGQIRGLIRGLTEPQGKPFDEFLQTLADRAAAEMAQSYGVAKIAKQELIEYRRDHMLPDAETLEKVMRYEAHLSRQFHRDLHELQRLQAMRLGHPVTVPVAIDVDVTSGPKSEPGGAE